MFEYIHVQWNLFFSMTPLNKFYYPSYVALFQGFRILYYHLTYLSFFFTVKLKSYTYIIYTCGVVFFKTSAIVSDLITIITRVQK